MHIAVLMTNTDDSAFAQAHPKDGEKYRALIESVRPDWQLTSFDVKDGIFPDDITAFDGVIITGSPASILDTTPWITELLAQIRTAFKGGVPMFGACFGHQAVALALGGEVARNPNGWAFGLIEMSVMSPLPWYDGTDTVLQYGAHIDHVTKLPEGARQVLSASNCDYAGFVISDQVYTTQNHPEMTPAFIAALVEEYASDLGPQIAQQARASLSRTADTEAFAQSIARFFEGHPSKAKR